ncbi:hypothetical protein ACTZWW_18985 [Salinarimonas sp. NSM]|uniref:hypothetical protein n=1 Tax=Salinarimonas sp. NSM TaxID=3458003 RepID=UPI004036F80B
MSQHSLTDYIVVFDPAAGEIGQAEFEARLCVLLDVPLDAIDEALLALPAARLVRALHEPDDGARRLRERLRILERRATSLAVAQMLARLEAGSGRPTSALRAALLANASHEPITDEERLVAEIGEAREEILALWPAAFDAVARWGTIDQRSAWSIGIGSTVYGMLAQALGRTAQDRIARDEFVAMCPRLVALWPLTPQSHEALHALLGIVRAAVAGEIRRPGIQLEKVN